MSQKPWFIYIIEAVNGNLYTGITTDLHRRFEEHQKGIKGAKFFNSSEAKEMVYAEEVQGRSEALKREAAIKKLKKADKLKLISANSNKLSILL